MVFYYHFTPTDNVSDILSEGLKPSAATGNRNTWLGVQGNPNFVYFFNKNIVRKIGLLVFLRVNPDITDKNTTLLQVELDETLLERDYDQLLYILEEDVAEEKKLERIKKTAKQLGAEVSDLSEGTIRAAIDAIPEDSWNKLPGSYRVKTSLPNTGIRTVQWEETVSLPVRIAVVILRPLVKLVLKLKNK